MKGEGGGGGGENKNCPNIQRSNAISYGILVSTSEGIY